MGSVFIFDREEGNSAVSRIVGSDLYVGNNPSVQDNLRCNANPKMTGMYSCDGKVGTYLGVYNPAGDYGNICRIQAFSLKANDF